MAKAGRLVKELMVRELSKALQERPNFFIASMGALKAAEADTLRKRLHGLEANVLMVKRTLGLRGVSGLKLNGETQAWFAGSVAVVFPGEEVITAAKALLDFAKDNQEKLTVRGGVVEGQFLDATGLREVAQLPPKPQLIAQAIFAIESPLADVVWTLERVLGDVAWVLEEASKKEAPAHG
ncbi:MAG: 50S ribosomal protein L10 [Candidatus Omnitrophica bacterium]|nr:50S ribosomal protein L10 [Candidatus Omnitrophota bacterium]